MEEAKVCTIISITARKEAGLEEFIGSVLEQDYPLDKIELIIVDKIKKSRPEITAILEGVGAKLYATHHLQDPPTKHKGPCPATARNFAISKSTGEWIITVDDLTTLMPDTVSKHMKEFEKGFGVLACSYVVTSKAENKIVDDRDDPGSRHSTDSITRLKFEITGWPSICTGCT